MNYQDVTHFNRQRRTKILLRRRMRHRQMRHSRPKTGRILMVMKITEDRPELRPEDLYGLSVYELAIVLKNKGIDMRDYAGYQGYDYYDDPESPHIYQ